MSDWVWDNSAPTFRRMVTAYEEFFFKSEQDLTITALESIKYNLQTGKIAAYPGLSLSPYNEVFKTAKNGRLYVSESGRPWRRVTDQDEVHDIRNYLSDAENYNLENNLPVNATGAQKRIFAEISAVPSLGTPAKEAKIVVPCITDLLQIEETCQYIGGAGRGLDWCGIQSLSRFGDKGSGYKWVGAAGGTMFDLRGINGSRIHGLNFSGGLKAKYIVRGREFYDGVNPLIGSSGVFVEFCRFSDPLTSDGDSACFAAGADNGVNTYPTDTYCFLCNDWNGTDENGIQGWGFRALAGGNTKNFFLFHNSFSYFYRAIEASSGVLTVIEINGGNIGYNRGDEASLIVGSGNAVTVTDGRMENLGTGYTARFIKSGGTNTGTVLQAKGFYINGNLPADDYAIITYGPSEISGSFENNGRVGSNSCKVQAPQAESASGGGGISLRSSTFGYNSTQLTAVPIYDGSNNPIGGGGDADYARNVGHRLEARNNVCGPVGGNKNIPLPDVNGDDIPNLREQMKTDGNTSGITIVRNANGNYVVTVPFGVFRTAPSGEVVIGELQLKSKESECILDTTVAFTGPSGTVQIRAGISIPAGAYADDSLILAHDVKSAPVRKGIADADKGVSLALATSVNGRGEYFGAWTGSGHSIKLKMILGAGALTDLVAGSITAYITHARVG